WRASRLAGRRVSPAFSGLNRDAGAGDGDLDDEAGALGGVVLDPDRAAVLADDLVHDRQAEAHPRDLRREVRQEELLLVVRADARAVVGHHDTRGPGPGQLHRLRPDSPGSSEGRWV